MKKEKKQNYDGAVVLGLNDALVEMSGALVGLSFALTESKLIATVGIITGFAAALSMGASEYLSAKEDRKRKPLKAATYTGITYIIAVLLLVTPYFLLKNIYVSAIVMLIIMICIIAVYTKYDSKIRNESFKKKFTEMLFISLGVATISFAFGLIVRKLLA